MSKQIIYHKHRFWLLELTLEAEPDIDLKGRIPVELTDKIEQQIIFDQDDSGCDFCVGCVDNGARYIDVNINYSWRILPLNFDYLYKVAMWMGNYAPNEALTQDIFIKYYGIRMGQHYYGKWIGEAKRNILWMLCYFNDKDGQRFCNMIAEQVEKYEHRVKK